MSSSLNLAANSAAIIVFGQLKSAKAPEGAWFRGENVEEVRKLARQLGYSAVAVTADFDKAILTKLKEGQLKSGAMLLGSIDAETLDRISRLFPSAQATASTAASARVDAGPAKNEAGAMAAQAAATNKPKEGELRASSGAEVAAQSRSHATPSAGDGAAKSAAEAQSSKKPLRLEPGQKVLSCEFDKHGEPDSWWDGVIIRAEDGAYLIRWRDFPKEAHVRRVPEHIAIKLSDM